MNACRIDIDETECMSFFMKDKEFLEQYNEIWEKSAILSEKNLIVNLYIIKNNEKINTKEGSQCIYIAVILIASVYIKETIVLKCY